MDIPQLIVNGLVTGCIIALAAIGLSMTYKILGFANFAHGDLFALGAYIALFLNVSLGTNIVLATLCSVVLCAGIGIGLDRTVWAPLRNKGAGRVSLIITSIGLALILRNLIIFAWGGDIENYDLPVRRGYEVLGLSITLNQILVIILAFLLMFVVYFILQKTKMGKAMRALADNMDLARISGIDVDSVIRRTWMIGVGLVAVAGVMYGLVTSVTPDMGWLLLLPMFAAVILGGIGNPYGAMLGGIIIGISQEVSTAFIPSEYKVMVSFVVLIVLLLIRPQGILGRSKE